MCQRAGHLLIDKKDLLLFWLFTYCPTFKGHTGKSVSQLSSQAGKGQRLSLLIQDLRIRKQQKKKRNTENKKRDQNNEKNNEMLHPQQEKF